jgi:hypothetical protein
MNHYAARQIKAGPNAGKWHYTCYNDRDKGAYPVGACGRFRNCLACDGRITNLGQVGVDRLGGHCPTCGGRGCVEVAEADRCPGHDTPEGAYEHQRQYLLGSLEVRGPKTERWPKHKCAVPDCENEATMLADLKDGWHYYEVCPGHATREAVAELFHVGESWSS